MSRDPLIISGGNSILYAAGITMDLRRRAVLDTDPIKREDGIKVAVTIKKNHCAPNRNPYVRTEYFAIFGQGIEQYLEVLENAVEQGILERAGAWIRDIDPKTGEPKEINGEKLNFQGRESFRNYCIDNPGYFKELKLRVRGVATQLTKEEIDGVQEEMKSIEDTVEKDVIAEITGKKAKKK